MTRPTLLLLALAALAGCDAKPPTRQPAPAANPGPKPTPPTTPPTTPQAAAQPAADMPFGSRDIPAKTKGSFRLAAWNIENLYDDQDDPANPWKDEPTSTKPPEQRRAAGEAIRRLDADVLALEEVESLEALRWFMEDQDLDKVYPYVASLDAGDPRGIEQAVLSKFPLANAHVWADHDLGIPHPDKLSDGSPDPDAGKPLRMARSPLAVDIIVPGEKPYLFTLIVLHAKSGRGYAFQRELEATKHTQWIAELQKADPARNIMVVGDFNARKSDGSVGIYTGAGLTDLFGQVKVSDPAFQTHVTNRIIDHMLASPAMAPEVLPSGRFVLALPLPGRNAPFSDPKPAGYASDHLPIAVEIRPVDAP